jgi:hypothetical protein
MKKRYILILLLIAAAGVFFSSAEVETPSVIGSAWDGPNKVKLTVEGDWTGHTIADNCVVSYGETADTYYSIEKRLDFPIMFSSRIYTIRAEISPAWKSNDKILVFGYNGVLGYSEFTTPK